MKKFLKIVLRIFLGLLSIAIIPIWILASICTCLFTDATLMWCVRFWTLCATTLISGKGFDDYAEEKYDD